jgi:HAE1 family hydrophobic/amphiphilic exporter-1
VSVLTRLSLANRAVITLLCLLLIGFGVYAVTALKQELIPSTQFPTATIIANYPGASPDRVERDVTEPIETAVSGVEGITGTTSTSAAGNAQITVEWEFGLSTDDMQSKLQSAIDGTGLPADVDPTVSTLNFDAFPVLMLAVSSDLDQRELGDALDEVAVSKINAVDGVNDTQVTGRQISEIAVTLRPDDLDRHEVEPALVQQAFQQYAEQLPPGSLDSDGKRFSVEMEDPLQAVDKIAALRIQGADGPVKLGDIADVAEQPAETTSISRINGKPALSVNVTKSADGNVVAVSHAVRDLLPEIEREIGGNTRFSVIMDQAPEIEHSIEDLSTEGALGLVMAIVVIMLFLLSIRPTIITAISIPLSLLIAMIGVYLADYTLNMITLAALTVAIGRVVDDSIVVIENIKRHQSRGEEFGPGLIIGAVKEVAGAVTASTLTTVAVFAPIALISGTTGELFRPFSVTVAVALLGSLLVALTIVPVLALWFMRPSRRQAQKAKHAPSRQRAGAAAAAAGAGASSLPADHDVHDSAETPLQRGYLPILHWTLRHPVITIIAAVIAFGLSVGMAVNLKTGVLDQGNQGLQLTQTLPAGSSPQTTDKAAKKLEKILAADPDVTVFQTTISTGGGGFFGGGGGANKATYTVSIAEDEESAVVLDRLSRQVEQRDDLGEVEIGFADTAGQLAVDVGGQDEKALAEGAAMVAEAMAEIPGVSSVHSDLAEQEPKLEVDVDEKRAAEYGMDHASIGLAVNQALAGTPVGTAVIDDQELDIKLWLRERVTSAEELEDLELPVTEKQTRDAQERASDRIKDDQDAQAEEQEREADEQAAEQQKQSREAVDELNEQIDELQEQLEELRNAPPPAAPPVQPPGQLPPGQVPPGQVPPGELPPGELPPGQVPPGQAPTTQQPGADAAAAAQREATKEQIKQLKKQIKELKKQRNSTEEQIADAEELAAKQEARAKEAERLAERSEKVPEIRGESIKLSRVAEVITTEAPAAINRIDGVRTVSVTGVPPEGDLGTASAALQQSLSELKLPSGVTATIAGASAEQDESFSQLFAAMGIAIVIVYMIMVATFRSLLQPLILLVSVPFAATGAIGLLLATGTPLDVAGLIGMLMLIGIVVTNAIVLIDLINQYRSAGASVDDAVIHGARLRLRPIIMTAAATVMALIPMAVGLTGGGVFISRPLAIVVIGGLISSTVLTLLIVPVLYHFIEKFRERRRERRAARDVEESAVPADAE